MRATRRGIAHLLCCSPMLLLRSNVRESYPSGICKEMRHVFNLSVECTQSQHSCNVNPAFQSLLISKRLHHS